MKKQINDWLRVTLFVVGGAAAGLGYYYLFGCSGNCAVTANPWMTMAYMGVVGALLSAAVKKKEA